MREGERERERRGEECEFWVETIAGRFSWGGLLVPCFVGF